MFVSNTFAIVTRRSVSLQLNSMFRSVELIGFGGIGNLYVPYVRVLLRFPLHSAFAYIVFPVVSTPSVADHSDAYPVLTVVYGEFLSGVAIAYATFDAFTVHFDGASCDSLTLNDLTPAPGPNMYIGPDVVVMYESP